MHMVSVFSVKLKNMYYLHSFTESPCSRKNSHVRLVLCICGRLALALVLYSPNLSPSLSHSPSPSPNLSPSLRHSGKLDLYCVNSIGQKNAGSTYS